MFSTLFLADIASAIHNLTFTGMDVLDILFIAFLAYMAMQLLRETRSASVVVGVLSVVVIYLVAGALDLPLTHYVLQIFVGGFFILIAIVFQRELRRFFSSFGFFGIVRRTVIPSDSTVETIAHTCMKFAHTKIGAIMIFPGREQIDRFLEGGYRLNGEVSEPLLLSIFDTSSPGHDGAVVIEGPRLRRFGVHLPLAEQMEEVRQFGTRHRAALGIAERSDALVVVVSEEKGVVSVMQDGKRETMESYEDLRDKIQAFYSEKFSEYKVGATRRWVKQNAVFAGASLAIAVSIWFLGSPRFAVVQRNFVVSPEFHNAAPNLLVSDVVPQEIVVSLKGRSADFDSLPEGAVKAVLDLAPVNKEGWHQLLVTANEIKAPYNFSVVQVDPQRVQIYLSKYNPNDPAKSIKAQ